MCNVNIILILNRWHDELMNIIDPLKAEFKGWICIRGLPFLMWNIDICSYISSSCGGLIDIDKQEKDFSILSEANIRVQNMRFTEIPQVVHQ